MIVKVLDNVNDYEEAIKITCDILQKRDSINDSYYEAILNKIDEFGSYFCIAPKIAMPHARPEDGALKTDLCLLKLNKPVDFLGKEVSLFFTLSAVDSSSHLEIMQKVAKVCMDQNKLNTILNLNNEKEIMEVM
ncbi:phosphoenolpyruvate-dependent sugar phosphotransferase system, EIIA 2 family protein [[Clostridium] bifermentans ATCC 638]|uniref:Ascorbate-specific PTS system EIIA component n=1 Tax=Paraclostridium bifermentans ATCC 638 = DSM 14991 TaxID=1233171 RepID=T4VKZ6_PARBF|nr:PTS sugar transporter subunit IIA [Paraclostridium bifermentans]EQK42148.1 phosphoenolpyruvate-dependent sugar phosphotransferase system, EIIA 2 family protein [[Clostridium] bifermentans ATCC 638] [Paraclostridium bifermentans ATCC 638 = DSM 14991]RIZ58903.1 PTS sugar transporter subunit IIA [Paraclostridium bifermentans]UAG19011.1 PTS sugar transporter subunit IIA [Paraclostridium bifermentans]